MSWADLAEPEPVEVLGATPRTIVAGVSERAPSSTITDASGQTSQTVSLLVLSGERLDPPTRLEVRGAEVRVLGTQSPPFPDAPSLVTCERVSPDLPDEVEITEPSGERVLNVATGLYEITEPAIWAGPAHVESGIPPTVESGGEDSPMDKVTITLPMSAPYRTGVRVRVIASRSPGLAGAKFTASGEVLDSSAALRRVVGYR